MRVVLGADHAGFELKEVLKRALAADPLELVDLGTHSLEPVDYPDIAAAVARRVVADRAKNDDALAVLVCGSGIGVSIAANKVKGARAASCDEPYGAEMARRHNDANVLCVGARMLGPGLAEATVRAFLAAPFEGGRHERRVRKIEALEE